MCVCVWHLQNSNCVSLVGQLGFEVLNPILNLFLLFRRGGVWGGGWGEQQPYVTVPSSEELNMDEKHRGVPASPRVYTPASDRKWSSGHQNCTGDEDLRE